MFDGGTRDRQVVVFCTDRAAELLVVTLVATAVWKRRREKKDKRGVRKVRDCESGDGYRAKEMPTKKFL